MEAVSVDFVSIDSANPSMGAPSKPLRPKHMAFRDIIIDLNQVKVPVSK